MTERLCFGMLKVKLCLENGHRKRGTVKDCGGTANLTSYLKSCHNELGVVKIGFVSHYIMHVDIFQIDSCFSVSCSTIKIKKRLYRRLIRYSTVVLGTRSAAKFEKDPTTIWQPPIPSHRDGWPHQNGWIFGKSSNRPLTYCILFKFQPCVKVRNLKYKCFY